MLTRCLADLLGGASPPHNVALTGPRGNGKTVLLNWFKRTCRDREPEVDVVALTPADIPTREALIDVLAPSSAVTRLVPRKVGVAAVGSVEWAPPAGGTRNLRADLTGPLPQEAAGVAARRGAHCGRRGRQDSAQHHQSTSARRGRRSCW